MRKVTESNEMGDKKSNAKWMGLRRFCCSNLLRQSSMFVSLLALTLGVCGCKSSAFAPRTGEYFQATRMGPGVGCYAYALPVMVGGGCIEKGGPLFLLGIPLFIAGLPIAGAGFLADVCVVSPAIDLVCLPYDACQPNHGFYIRIVDEDGKPLPCVRIKGTVIHGLEMDAKISGWTNAEGEFYVSRLSFERCWFSAHVYDRPDWWGDRMVKMENAKPGADGRYVFTFPLIKTTPGGWQAKFDGTREDLLQKVLPGKWSADSESRVWLQSAKEDASAEDPSQHWIDLRPSGGAHNNNWENCDCSWKLERKGEVEKDWHDAPSVWTWRARLTTATDNHDDYYLGEDEKGVYLSPGPFRTENKAVLKFRKVSE